MDISVITPFYKGNAYMARLFSCIAACAEHAPDLRIELVLVNDSPDCPICYEADWVQGFSMNILTNKENAGIHRARINGLSVAKGTFIQFLDQDDLLAPEALALQFAAVQNADVVVADGFEQDPRRYGPIYRNAAHQRQTTHPRFYYSVSNLISSPGQCLIRKSAIPQVWCETCISRNGSDDLFLWLVLLEQKSRFVVNPIRLYTHVHTGENVSADSRKILGSSFEVLQALKENGLISPRQERRFRRSRGMASRYAGKGRAWRYLTMLLYPDVIWEKLALRISK